MALSKAKREKIENLVLGVMKRLDTGKMLNYHRYKAMFAQMNDVEFEVWAKTMGHELDDSPQMFVLPFEEPKMTQIKDAADFLGIPLEEYVYYYHNDPKGVRTKVKVPVGYVMIKRMQQTLSKKNHYSFDNDDVSFKTGDVKGESKVASIQDAECNALTVIGADAAMRELLGPRGSSQDAKREMLRQIVRDGYCTLNDLPDDPNQKTALVTLNTYMLASGLRSDLINTSLQTEYTLKNDVRKR